MTNSGLAVPQPVSETYVRAVDVVARAVGIAPDRILQPSRHSERRARATAMYLTVVAGGHGQRSTARSAGIAVSRLHTCLRKIEDHRDDPSVDTTLTHLEEQLACAI